MGKEITIYAVKVNLDSKGWTEKVSSVECTEGDKVYTIISTNKRIKKENILVPDSIFIARPHVYNYHTYVLKEEDIVKAKEKLKAKISLELNIVKKQVDEVFDAFIKSM